MIDPTVGAKITGTLRRLRDGKGAVRMEGLYDTHIDDLWSAVTDPERLARWLVTVDGEPFLGGHFRAQFTSTWVGLARIDICDAPHHLLVTLSPGEDDESVIEATLHPEAGRTRLVIEERGLAIDDLAAHGSGWQAHAEDLSRHLAGEAHGWRERWIALTPAYELMAVELA